MSAESSSWVTFHPGGVGMDTSGSPGPRGGRTVIGIMALIEQL